MTRDDCPTCVSLKDENGRMPIGLHGPDCVGRKERDERLVLKRATVPAAPQPVVAERLQVRERHTHERAVKSIKGCVECLGCGGRAYVPGEGCQWCGYVLPGDGSAS